MQIKNLKDLYAAKALVPDKELRKKMSEMYRHYRRIRQTNTPTRIFFFTRKEEIVLAQELEASYRVWLIESMKDAQWLMIRTCDMLMTPRQEILRGPPWSERGDIQTHSRISAAWKEYYRCKKGLPKEAF